MKNIVLLITVILFFASASLFAAIGPIPLDESDTLPDGYAYGTVTATFLDDACPNSYDGVKITADPDDSILNPGPNFGIQKFGFNYPGDPDALDIEVLGDTKHKWKVDLSGTLGPYGIFLYCTSTTGKYRMNPLEIEICHCCSDLSEGDFIIPNSEGYTYGAHIADFTFTEEPGYEDVTSAFFGTSKTTLIELVELKTVVGNREVVIIWSTASEIDHAGFNLYRAESELGEYIRINSTLIPAEGSPTHGRYYEFIDKDVQNRKTYFYILEDVNIYGMSVFHGPVSATPRRR